nr:probable magnesium transporter NIPA4 [Ipomoea batatas]
MSADNIKGLVLAISSSFFIGSSFIVKKKGLKKAGSGSGLRAGAGGYSYLLEPLWWAGMVTRERLHIFGIIGCVLCIVGSTIIVLHAPQEREIENVQELWDLATEPGFLLYGTMVVAAVVIIIVYFLPKYGQTHIIAYVGVCSLVGSIGVRNECQSIGHSTEVNVRGDKSVSISSDMGLRSNCSYVLADTSELLKQVQALDTFNSSVVSPIYYVMFTTLTIVASVIMFKDWNGQYATQIVTELGGFVTILSGTFLLHKTKDLNEVSSPSFAFRNPKYEEADGINLESIPLKRQESMR